MTHSSTSPDSRIDELETRLALQDHSILELSSEVYRQQQQISQLESMASQLAGRLQSIELNQPASAPSIDVPPHY